MREIIATVSDDHIDAGSAILVPWWSYTKTVLAAAALVLVANGRLTLDQPMPGRRFTLRHLLQHRAGLPDYGSLAAYHEAVAGGGTAWTPAEMLRRAAADSPVFEPGEGWGYSNIGYFMVRTLIERTTGLDLVEALNLLVLGPLGIEGVVLARQPADLERTAWGNARGYDPAWVYHGLLAGPAVSAALLLHRLLAGALLPADLLEEMCGRHPVAGAIEGRPWRTAGYGLGLMIGDGDPAGLYAGHSGAGPGSVAAVYRLMPSGPLPAGYCTAAVFAGTEDIGWVERQALALACGRR